jgi:hypothetical protein
LVVSAAGLKMQVGPQESAQELRRSYIIAAISNTASITNAPTLMRRGCGFMARNQLTKHNKNPHMQMARTTRETVHGNPGERRILPVNTLVVIIPASNLPPVSPIKYWAHPVVGYPWPAETEAWAEDVGVGLYADDVALVKMPAFPVT